MQINFYHLTKLPLDKALPKLLEKVITMGYKVVVKAKDAEQIERLNEQFWTYTTKFFLPHGSKNDPFPERQPIFLTDQDENPNDAKVLALVGGATSDMLNQYEKCIYMFDGNAEDEIVTARQRWSEYKKQSDYELTYWQQNKKGVWEKAL